MIILSIWGRTKIVLFREFMDSFPSALELRQNISLFREIFNKFQANIGFEPMT